MSALLRQVRPPLAGVDIANGALANFKLARDFALREAAGEQSPDFPHLLLGQFGSGRSLTSATFQQTESDRVVDVFGGGDPFEIVSSIVRFATVDVIDVHWLIGLAEKGERNQPVEAVGSAHTTFTQNDRVVAVSRQVGPHDPLGDALSEGADLAGPTGATRNDPADRANAPVITRVVKPFETGNWPPLLAHGGCS